MGLETSESVQGVHGLGDQRTRQRADVFAFTLRGKSVAEHVWLALWIAVVLVTLIYVCEPIDGYGGWAVSHLAQIDYTEYSAGYSDRGFRQVRVGMTEQQVRELIGEPLDTYSVRHSLDDVGWRYARSPRSHSYHVRVVLFKTGRVSRIFRDYYVD